MKKVSVIIPTYNRYDLVREAIDSALNQDFRNLEIIVIDDGSTDETYKIKYAYNGRIKYIYQINQGISKARNRGIKSAQGNYIAFLDSDDKWLQNKISSQVTFLESIPDSLISYTKEIWIRNNKRVNPPKAYLHKTADITEKLLSRCFIGTSTVMAHRKLFDKIGYFDEMLPICEDLDMWLRIALKYPLSCLDSALTYKRMGEWPQLSTSIWGVDRYRISILENLIRRNMLSKDKKQLFYKTINNKSGILAKGSFKHRHPLQGIRYSWKWLKSINTLN